MSNKYLTHEELQNIEHANKILEAHLELVKMVVNESEAMLNNYIPIMKTYVHAIIDIRKMFSDEVIHIGQSTRELKLVTANTQNVTDFCSAIVKLDALLTPSPIDKLNRISNDKS